LGGYAFFRKHKNKNYQAVFIPLVFVLAIIGGIYVSNQLALIDKRFDTTTSSFSEKQQFQQKILSEQSGAGSAYDLGTTSGNPIVIALFAFITTVFRPFLWEVKNPFMLLNFMETFLFILLLYFVLFKWGIKSVFKFFSNNNFVLFALVFTFLLSAIVGSTSGNFGTLARYKVPILPFFTAAILLMFAEYNKQVPEHKKSFIHKKLQWFIK
jgi:hypothetical protein